MKIPYISDYLDIPLSPFAIFCIGEHRGDMWGDESYEKHLRQVVGLAIDYGYDCDVQEAGWSHDLMEDKDKTQKQIEERSNSRIAQMTWAVSGFGATRQDRLLCVVGKIPLVPGSEILKMIDRFVNIVKCLRTESWSMLSVYVREHDLLSTVLPSENDHSLMKDLNDLVNYSRELLSDINPMEIKKSRLKR